MTTSMSVPRKTKRHVVLYLSLLLFLYVLVPNPHRQQFDRAFASWHRDLTRENEAFLRVQQPKNTIVELKTSAIGAFVRCTAGLASYTVARRLRR
jgi:hypothetical protein